MYFVEKNDVNQSNIRLGHLGMKTNDPDYYAAQVMNEVLGGGFASRLFSNVRSKKGLAYGVFGGVGAGLHGHPGSSRSGCAPSPRPRWPGIDALREEIDGTPQGPARPRRR